MAAAPVKSPLHNFPLTFLRWGGGGGSNNHSRCRRPIAGAEQAEPAAEGPSRPHRAGSRAARNRLAPCSAEKPKESHSGGGEGDEAAEAKPWNLRPRKALFAKAARELHEPEGAAAGGTGESGQGQNQQQQQVKSTRLRGLSESAQLQNQNQNQQMSSEMAAEKKRKFWIALSRDEIEEDIFIMTGSRPARRPKKRPKNVQKQLDAVFPGLWLVGITADAYRVAEAQPKR